MATLKQRVHRMNSNGTYDIVHYETEASLVTYTNNSQSNVSGALDKLFTSKADLSNPTFTDSITISKAGVMTKIHNNSSSTADYGTQLIDYNTEDATKYTRLSLINSATLANKLAIVDSAEGTKYIYGEHNKPTPAAIGAATSSHTHGNITSAGKIGSTTGRVVTSSNGTITVSSDTYDSNDADPTTFDYTFISRVKQSASGAVTAVRHKFPIYDKPQTTDEQTKSTFIIGGKTPSDNGEGTDTTSNGSGTMGGISSTYMNSGYKSLGYSVTITFKPNGFSLPSGKKIYIYNFFGNGSNDTVYLTTNTSVASNSTITLTIRATFNKSLMILPNGTMNMYNSYKLEDIWTSTSNNCTFTMPNTIKQYGFLQPASSGSGVYLQAICDVGTNNRMDINATFRTYYM